LGIEIQQDRFTERDFVEFRKRLLEGLEALDVVLARPGFGRGERSIGAELELFLIDEAGRPLPISREVVSAADTPYVGPEMGEFDIELSTPPVALAGRPFSALRSSLHDAVGVIRTRALARGARIVAVSILPTFQRRDFHPGTITDLSRYRALAAGLRRLRRAPFRISIDGDDPLELVSNDVAMEAANTAFQIHLRADAGEFARLFNAAMMLTAPTLAASGNSPTFLGHRLWEETRVELFKQAGDDRPPDESERLPLPARIDFASGWVRDGAAELFKESVALHEPILPVCGEEDALACARSGGVPELSELRLHHGTVWKWNRPVYDPSGEGHLRIELRALPAGPTLDDMLANAAFLVGTTLAFAPDVCDFLPRFPFALAERNFYHAARYGLQAELAWPTGPGQAPELVRAGELALRLVPRAQEGLERAGVDSREAARFLAIFRDRVETGVTGAVWQRRTLDALLRKGVERDEALRRMLARYLTNFEGGKPVHTWELDR
jgi:gamma-glutamyl:cysteine ligase YbdK (ATP-grasp superfamily)